MQIFFYFKSRNRLIKIKIIKIKSVNCTRRTGESERNPFWGRKRAWDRDWWGPSLAYKTPRLMANDVVLWEMRRATRLWYRVWKPFYSELMIRYLGGYLVAWCNSMLSPLARQFSPEATSVAPDLATLGQLCKYWSDGCDVSGSTSDIRIEPGWSV